MKNEASSAWDSDSPSMFPWTKAEVRSPVGSAIRAAAISSIMAVSSAPASTMAVTGWVPAGTYSGSPLLKMTLEHRKASPKRSAGTPIIWQMTSRGRGAATSVTKSHWPRGPTPSTTCRATSVMWSSMLRTIRGLNAWDTIRRSRACRGLSVEIMPAKYSTISGGRSRIETAPGPER